MIDIFNSGRGAPPYVISTALLLRECMGELGQFFLTLLFLTGVFLLAKSLGRKMALGAALALALGQSLYVFCVSIHSEFFFSFLFAAILTAQAYLLGLIPTRADTALLLFTCFLFPARLFNSTSALLGHLWLFWVVFSGCYLVCWLEQGSLRGHHFSGYFTSVVLSISAYGLYIAVSFLEPCLTAWLDSHAWGLSSTMVILCLALLSVSIVIRRYCGTQITQIQQFSQRHGNLERCFSWLSLLVLALCLVIFLPFTPLASLNTLLLLFFPILCLVLLLLQMVFVLLLYRVTFYKDQVAASSWEHEGLKAYYRDLGNNLEAMQEIRHDIKNLFFTMGGFVDRSNDEEMKAFFWEKIYPQGESSIRQNELLSTIYQLPNEALRAFLYLKVSQIMQRKVQVFIRLNLQPEHFHLGMDIVDLTRVLGILLDNALEEAQQVPQGQVDIQISSNDHGCSYLVRNSVSHQTVKSGVRPGVSTKGPGHGNGLLIVQRILSQYRTAVLNSCMQGQNFVQCLTITESTD